MMRPYPFPGRRARTTHSAGSIVNIGQIKYFVSVFDSGSLSMAAKRQFVTVQAVSKAIADLEREIGRRLFVRESRGVTPTEFGLRFHEKAVEALRAFAELESLASEEDGGEAVDRPEALRLALCSPTFNGYGTALESIRAFLARQLDTDAVDVSLIGGKEALAALRGGAVDGLIVIGAIDAPEADCITLGAVTPAVVMAESHPLAAKKSVSLSDIDRYPVAFSPDFDQFNESVLSAYRKRGFLAETEEIFDHDGFMRFAEQRDRIVFCVDVPALTIEYPGTVLRPIDEADAIAIPLCVVAEKSRKTPMYRMLERLLTQTTALAAHRGDHAWALKESGASRKTTKHPR